MIYDMIPSVGREEWGWRQWGGGRLLVGAGICCLYIPARHGHGGHLDDHGAHDGVGGRDAFEQGADRWGEHTHGQVSEVCYYAALPLSLYEGRVGTGDETGKLRAGVLGTTVLVVVAV